MALCVLFGVICAASILVYLNAVRGEAEADRSEMLSRYGGEQVEVCVAARDLAPGEVIDVSAVQTKLWLADLLPDDAVRSSDDIMGKQVTSRILKGEAVSLKRFESASYSLEIPAGLTAVSVPAKDVQAVGGAVAPGARVDIFATGNAATRLICRNTLVLATSASAASDSKDAAVTWITVAVSPSMVEELVAAAQGTQLYFALPAKDEDDAEENGRDNGSDGSASSDEQDGNDVAVGADSYEEGDALIGGPTHEMDEIVAQRLRDYE